MQAAGSKPPVARSPDSTHLTPSPRGGRRRDSRHRRSATTPSGAPVAPRPRSLMEQDSILCGPVFPTSVSVRGSALTRLHAASTLFPRWRPPSLVFCGSEPPSSVASGAARGAQNCQRRDRQSPHTLSPTADWVVGLRELRIPGDGRLGREPHREAATAMASGHAPSRTDTNVLSLKFYFEND
ncbi:hypothetical protein NDU88_003107 [Pleurodeles waltl]|uniref:Uncharacterized protein n=1 Tax=Pleurodeles waltl TaxID=8319 RepID=A0AAV7MQ96_PLEWA|nr:hypothetical protein NDU88_003107 [Pleurodeles waltl]